MSLSFLGVTRIRMEQSRNIGERSKFPVSPRISESSALNELQHWRFVRNLIIIKNSYAL